VSPCLFSPSSIWNNTKHIERVLIAILVPDHGAGVDAGDAELLRVFLQCRGIYVSPSLAPHTVTLVHASMEALESLIFVRINPDAIIPSGYLLSCSTPSVNVS
jgi:hypothetical protein